LNKFGDRIHSIIQTDRGNIHIDDINIGDIVYDYTSGAEHEVRAVVDSRVEDIYQIIYTDDRCSYHRESELIYVGGSTITCIHGLMLDFKENPNFENNPQAGNIIQYPIKYPNVKTPLNPDPYLAGALLIHGDLNYKHINLPYGRSQANNYINNKYQTYHGHTINGYLEYFIRKGDPDNNKIEWEELFPKYSLLTISDEYIRASINDRWQFIRGAFDIGYLKELSPDKVSIFSRDKNRLIDFQKILWSVGVISTINKYINEDQKNDHIIYMLEVHCDIDLYPSFFYHQPYKEYFLQKNKNVVKKPSYMKVRIENIIRSGRGYSKKIILDNIGTKILTDNFLPKVSS